MSEVRTVQETGSLAAVDADVQLIW